MAKQFKQNIKGEEGESIAETHYLSQNIPYVRSTRKDDLTKGIDCYVGEDKVPSDVKNTPDIFAFQILLNSETINVRHPFKTNTECTHYIVIENNKVKEHVGVKERLIRDFVKDEQSYIDLVTTLQGLEGKDYIEYGISLNQACLKLKQLVTPYLKDNVYCSYPVPELQKEDIYFKLCMKKENPIIKPSTSKMDITSILAKLKSKHYDSTPEKKNRGLEENIIVIVI